MGKVREVDLHLTPRTSDYPCGIVATEVLAPEPLGPLLFVAYGPSHQPSYEYERELQSAAAARLVEEMAGRLGTRHVVVAGDFNADPDADSVAFWRGRRSLGGTSVCYRDAWQSAHGDDPGHTFTPRNPHVAENKPGMDAGRRIDYILVRCDDPIWGPPFKVSACELAFDEPLGGVWASDHFGVVADLSARTQSGGPAR